MSARAVALLALVLGPAGALALEPRYDHRDERGFVLEPLVAYDAVAVSGKATRSTWRPGLRVAYGWDLLGEGNELFLGAQTAFSWADPHGQRIRLALDARYRAYFGTEQWKTFYELGLWAPLSSRLAIGPLLTIGIAYDFSRTAGLFVDAGASFGTGPGPARMATFSASAGAQYRF